MLILIYNVVVVVRRVLLLLLVLRFLALRLQRKFLLNHGWEALVVCCCLLRVTQIERRIVHLTLSFVDASIAEIVPKRLKMLAWKQICGVQILCILQIDLINVKMWQILTLPLIVILVAHKVCRNTVRVKMDNLLARSFHNFKILLRNPPILLILYIWFFDNFSFLRKLFCYFRLTWRTVLFFLSLCLRFDL